MGSSAGNHPKGRRFTSENNFAPKQKGINTALRYEQCVNFLKVLMRASPFCFFCVKTKWIEEKESYVVWEVPQEISPLSGLFQRR